MANPGRRKRSYELLNLLLEKAGVQGYLTTDDLMEAVPDVTQDAERLEAIMTALRHRGVDIFDQEEAEAELEEESIPEGFTGTRFYSDLAHISSDDTIGL